MNTLEHWNTLFLHEMVRRTNLNCSSLLYDSISYVREMCLQGKYEFQTLRSNQAPAAYYVRSNNWIIVEFHYLDSTCTRPGYNYLESELFRRSILK